MQKCFEGLARRAARAAHGNLQPGAVPRSRAAVPCPQPAVRARTRPSELGTNLLQDCHPACFKARCGGGREGDRKRRERGKPRGGDGARAPDGELRARLRAGLGPLRCRGSAAALPSPRSAGPRAGPGRPVQVRFPAQEKRGERPSAHVRCTHRRCLLSTKRTCD